MDDSTLATAESELTSASGPAVSWRECAAVAAAIALADVSIYRGGGYSGVAALVAGVPLLLRYGMVQARPARDVTVLTVLLAAGICRLAWCGSPLAVSVTAGLVLMFAMALAGRRPFIPELLSFVGEVQANAFVGLARYRQALVAGTLGRPISPTAAGVIGFALPAVAVSVFSVLFLFANPDLARRFGEGISQALERLRIWVSRVSLTELLFCMISGWLAVGLIRARRAKSAAEAENEGPTAPSGPLSDALYSGFRNTLIAVTTLFAAYLVFEFQTLWFRTFPKGFYYAGYAHQGAFYLTVALGLATLTLSAIFRGATLNDSRLPALRRWGVLWAIENLVLALAVYNRLFIYIDFNGMTRMRSIGLLGVSAVVAGGLLVVVKIARNRDSTWLIRRQLWVLAFAVYLYAVLPIDAWVIRYNVRKVLSGVLPPSVQLSEHPTSTEGLLELSPLLSCSDVTIREGIRAWLSREWQRRKGAQPADWTRFQLADQRLQEQLASLAAVLGIDDSQRLSDWEAFRKYAYQWY